MRRVTPEISINTAATLIDALSDFGHEAAAKKALKRWRDGGQSDFDLAAAENHLSCLLPDRLAELRGLAYTRSNAHHG